MKHNMGKADRVIRSIVGLGLLYAIFSKALSGLLAVILGLFAVVLLATAAFGYCPPYGWLGIKTCKWEEHGDKTAAALWPWSTEPCLIGAHRMVRPDLYDPGGLTREHGSDPSKPDREWIYPAHWSGQEM